jgi:site-specific recombinase XerD
MRLGDAIALYIDFNQSIGMRFQVDAAILTAFHRHAGDVDLAAISPDVVAAFLQPRHRVTSTWHMQHRALRRFYQQAMARGLAARSPVPTVVPRVTETFIPHIYSHEAASLIDGHRGASDTATLHDRRADVSCVPAAPVRRRPASR